MLLLLLHCICASITMIIKRQQGTTAPEPKEAVKDGGSLLSRMHASCLNPLNSKESCRLMPRSRPADSALTAFELIASGQSALLVSYYLYE